MCIAVLSTAAHPRWRLVVAANRDEYHARPAAPLGRWEDRPGILAGHDLAGGGTWLGIHEAGRLVLVTNYRVPGYPQPGRPSRGALVIDLLEGTDPQDVPLAGYNPFTLVRADAGGASLLTNHPAETRRDLAPGIHGVSNGPFDPPWPKTMRLLRRFEDWLAADILDFTPLFTALADDSPTETGESGPEARFSGVFVRDPVYGTRCSTVIAVDQAGRGRIVERRFDAEARTSGETALEFQWPRA